MRRIWGGQAKVPMIEWKGVAIEFSIPVSDTEEKGFQEDPALDELARRLGL